MKQIQTKKNILDKLEKICPIWSNYLRENPDFTPVNRFQYGNKTIDIADGSCCIVGEAHGFPEYPSEGLSNLMYHNCETCYNFSIGILFQDRPNLEKLLDSFLNHWEESHQ